ncbi:hypothetical protein SLS55_010004 [Diplodia seriata]|uniref:Uncharacterized protein n=1 Tax=Diplodia seriata TaxID=420778 RepID=A0ABR3C1Q8_9PEZI
MAPSSSNDGAFTLANTSAVLQWRCPQTSSTRHLGAKTHSTTTPSTRLTADIRLDPTARTFDLSLRLPVDLTAFARPTLIHIPIPAHQIASLSATHLPTRTAPPAVHNTFVQRRAQRPSAAAKNRRDGDADEDDDDGDDDNDDEPTITRLALTLSSPLSPIGPSPHACGGSPPTPRDRRARAALAALHSLLLCNNNNDPPPNAAATSDEAETATTTDDDEDNADDSPPSPTNANALTLYLPTNRPFTSSSLALPLHHLPTAITEQWPSRQPQPRHDLRRMYGGRGGAVLGLDVLCAAIGGGGGGPLPPPLPPSVSARNNDDGDGGDGEGEGEGRAESPPSYDEIGPGPSPPPFAASGKRKGRSGSGSSEAEAAGKQQQRQRLGEKKRARMGEKGGVVGWGWLQGELGALRAEVEGLRGAGDSSGGTLEALGRKVEALGARVAGAEERAERERAEMRSEVEARLEGQRRAFEERLEAQGKLFQATLDAVEARWSERYEAWEAHMEGRIDDHFDGVRFDTDRAIEGADARWDDEIHLVKNELRDFVREEVGQAEENIKDHLRSGGANVTIEFV